ncbi:MAG: hypothetical protein JW846_02115 [Dehalococcoidia bacterium]|nr:hypothetical protein [Dehalococcoidia bacterium]
MTNETQRLIASLSTSDQLKEYLSNLQHLTEEGAVTDEQYATVRGDYEKRLAATTREIEMLRGALGSQLELVRSDISSLTSERETIDIRFKAGEISLAKSRNEDRRLRAQIDKLERNEKRLATLVAAETAAGLTAPKIVAPRAAPQEHGAGTESRRAIPHSQPAVDPDSTSRLSARGILNSKLRIAAVVVALVLLISIRLPWLAPSQLLASSSAAEAGVTVSFFVGLGGLFCSLAAIGATFISSGRARGALHIVLGVLALMALVAAIALGEMPLHSSYFRQLIVIREGLYVYTAAALTLVVFGMIQRRER